MAKRNQDDRLKRDIVAIGFATLGALLLASLLYGSRGGGFLPQAIYHGLLLTFGVGAYLLPVVAFVLQRWTAWSRSEWRGPRQ